LSECFDEVAMSSRLPRGRRAAALLSVCAAAGLHPATHAAGAQPARPDPTRIEAEVPPLQHRSALQQYRRLTDEPRRDWRAANAEVARIGGWRAYLREAHAPEPAASTPAAPGLHHGHTGGRR
jgi:hypothetical protein